jgi:hypothetical protein
MRRQTREGSGSGGRNAMVSGRDSGQRTLVIGGSIIGAIGIGWFVLSHVMLRATSSDAVVEALGVMLALTIVASVIGAVVRSVRDGSTTEEAGESGQDEAVRSPAQRP